MQDRRRWAFPAKALYSLPSTRSGGRFDREGPSEALPAGPSGCAICFVGRATTPERRPRRRSFYQGCLFHRPSPATHSIPGHLSLSSFAFVMALRLFVTASHVRPTSTPSPPTAIALRSGRCTRAARPPRSGLFMRHRKASVCYIATDARRSARFALPGRNRWVRGISLCSAFRRGSLWA